MTDIRWVVAATDFSQDAVHAGTRAALVAAERGTALDLLHVVEPDSAMALRDWLAVNRDLRSLIEQQLAMQLAAQARQLAAAHGVQVRELLRFGAILKEAPQAAADAGLLVVGARGTHTLRRLTFGTTAERLMRSTATPLLVVRQEPAGPYRRVLVLTDFSPASQAALQAALVVAPGAAIHLMHVFDLPFHGKLRLAGVREEEIDAYRQQALADATRLLQDSLPGPQAHRLHTSVLFGDVRTEALRVAAEMGADLLAVGKQGSSMLGDMFLGSTTSCMIGHAPCDVLGVSGG